VAQRHPTGSEETPFYARRSSRFGSEPPSVEDVVDIWRYAILELHARNDDDSQWQLHLVNAYEVEAGMVNLVVKLCDPYHTKWHYLNSLLQLSVYHAVCTVQTFTYRHSDGRHTSRKVSAAAAAGGDTDGGRYPQV